MGMLPAQVHAPAHLQPCTGMAAYIEASIWEDTRNLPFMLADARQIYSKIINLMRAKDDETFLSDATSLCSE